MKTVEEIKKQMKIIKWFIGGHESQIIHHLGKNEFEKVQEYSLKIAKLEVKYDLLKWVLNEPI